MNLITLCERTPGVWDVIYPGSSPLAGLWYAEALERCREIAPDAQVVVMRLIGRTK